MERNNWLDIRKHQKYTTEALHEYWNTHKKSEYKDLLLDEFGNLLKVYIENGGTFNQNKINDFFDRKFNIISILDKNGSLIKQI